jgi:hypothetical protein
MIYHPCRDERLRMTEEVLMTMSLEEATARLNAHQVHPCKQQPHGGP